MNSKHREIEFKYNAKDISLVFYHEFVRTMNFKSYKVASGMDHFYTSEKQGQFYRIREDHGGIEMTFKAKTDNDNNYVRIEHNIKLSSETSKADAEAYLETLGYKYTGQIFKTCFIYFFDYWNVVYYVCYDKELEEMGRFVEIEMKEDHPWASDDQAYKELSVLEMTMRKLGVSRRNRETQSLFEMFGANK